MHNAPAVAIVEPERMKMHQTILGMLIRPMHLVEFVLGAAMFIFSIYALVTYTEGYSNAEFTSLSSMVGRWPYVLGLLFGAVAMWHACRKARGDENSL